MGTYIKVEVDCVYEYLIKHGHVFTIRRFRQTGKGIRIFRKGKTIGKGTVEHILKIDNYEQLDPFVAESGFESRMDWVSELAKMAEKSQYLSQYKAELHLYKLTLESTQATLG